MNKLSLYDLVKTVVAAKNESVESLSADEIESKFTTLTLAFKTDKLTLDQRLNLQKHQRDVAELDANNELQSLRDSVRNLSQLLLSSEDLVLSHMRPEIKELLNKLDTQVNVVCHTNAKISSRSEVYGAVKQEERMSSAFDVILIHSENLKKDRELQRRELEKTKKLLHSGNKKIDFDSDSDNESVPLRRSIRSISTTIIPKMNLIRVRRASVSAIEILPNLDRKSVQTNTSARNVSTIPSYLSNRSRRCSMPVVATSPAAYKSRFAIDNESLSSHLEMTAEERCDSESDCDSYEANNDSDNDNSCHPILPKKGPEEEMKPFSNDSEQNNNLTHSIDENKELIETFSHRFSHQNSRENNDNSSEDNIELNQTNSENENNNQSIISLIEFQYFLNLFKSVFDGRVVAYLRRIVHEMRLILAVILLISAVFIVIWSVVPIGLPCECQCRFWNTPQDSVQLSNQKISSTQ